MAITITRLFDDREDAIDAIHALEQLGVSHDDVSLISQNRDGWYDEGGKSFARRDGDRDRDHRRDHDDGSDVAKGAGGGAGAGAVVGGGAGLLAGLGLLAIPGIGPVVAAGWLTSTAVGALAGAAVGGALGGLVGALTESGESEEHAQVYAEGVRRGGTLVSVRVPEHRVGSVDETLRRYGGVDADARGRDYRERGWKGFDPNAPAYSDDEYRQERSRYGSRRTRDGDVARDSFTDSPRH